MAKKNSPKDTAGVVFDTQSKMVISQGGTFEKMKEKINSVRAVVPNKSNNEIVLVLQHFENCVDRAVQAFVEGSAAEILKEWNVTGKKKPRKKKKPKPQPESQINAVEAESTPSSITKDAVNGFHGNSLTLDGVSVDFVFEQLDSANLDMAEIDSKPTTPECSKQATASLHKQGGLSCQSLQEISSGNETQSQSGFSSQQMPASSSCLPSEEGQHGGAVHKKMASNIEKSVKDLHRCIASLTRYRLVVNDEMDSSIKRMKQTFAEIQSCLMDREVALLAEMDKVKAEATAILDVRQRKAENLRRLSDQSAAMSEEQLGELRADIKHFVSERKYDEDLGRAVKFTYEMEPLKKGIMCFGQVYHPQTGYSHRSRCSSSSIVTSPKREGMYLLQPTEGPSYPTQPHRQGHESNVRPGQGLGLQPRGQRLNDDMQHYRNQNRTSHRYQGNHFQGTTLEVASHSPRLPSTTLNGPAQTIALSARHCQPSPNGLPQRPLPTHRP